MGEEFVKLVFNGYTIYSGDGKYYFCISDEEVQSYQIFIGFSERDLGNSSKEAIVNEIRKVSDLISSLDKSVIYVLPVISPSYLQEVAMENDGIGYRRIMNDVVQPCVREIHGKLSKKNKQVNPVIRMIKRNDVDRKFIDGVILQILDEYKRDDLVVDIEYSALRQTQTMNDATFDRSSPSFTVANDNRTPQSGIAPVNHQYDEASIGKSNQLTRKKVKTKQEVSPGFSSIKFIVMVLTVSIVLGIGLGYLLIK